MDLSPKYKSVKFKCPHCGVASQQTWFDTNSASSAVNDIISHFYYDYRVSIADYKQEAISNFISQMVDANKRNMENYVPRDFSVATCYACSKVTLWINKDIVYPKRTDIAPPNADMSNEVKDLYNEAASILIDSPKGATAILRLALQTLLKDLGKTGKNINNDIKELVEDGLSPKIQQALDLLRVVGNNAVHPGQIDLDDGGDVAMKMFHVLNFIADELITKPKELALLYDGIVPEETKSHINQRDGTA